MKTMIDAPPMEQQLWWRNRACIGGQILEVFGPVISSAAAVSAFTFHPVLCTQSRFRRVRSPTRLIDHETTIECGVLAD